MSSPTILVTGATGTQGGALSRALLRNKWSVNALVRDPTSTASQALKSQGATLFKGDWDDVPVLEAAAAGCTGVFLNVYPDLDPDDPGAELRHARNILAVSKRAGIKHVVYSSAIAADRYQTLDTKPQGFLARYFHSKHTIEQEVKNGGHETWTIFRGVNFTSNYLVPSASFMFPELIAEARFVTAFRPDTKVLLVDPEDIGAFTFAAFSEPQRFGGKGIDLAAEALTVDEMAKVMEKVSGKPITVYFRTEEEIEAQKATSFVIPGQLMFRDTPPWVNIEEIKAWGVPLTTFEQYLEKEKDRLLRTIGPAA